MKREEVLCPHCGRRIFDAENGVKTQTKEIMPHDPGPPKNRWKPDYYIKCWKCHTLIGYRKVS